MINLNAIGARIKRKKIREFSGECFLESESIVSSIPALNAYRDQQYLFGIYQSEGTWTVISVTSVYASYDYKQVILRIKDQADKIHDYFGQEGN